MTQKPTLTREQIEALRTSITLPYPANAPQRKNRDALCDMALAYLDMVPRPISEAPAPTFSDDQQLLIITHDRKVELKGNDRDWWVNMIKSSKEGDYIGHLPEYFILPSALVQALPTPEGET